MSSNTPKRKEDSTLTDLPLTASAISLLTGERVSLTPQQAWVEGTNIKKALKHAPEQVRAYVVKEVAGLCKEMDMKKTISTNEELDFVCRTILEDFPTLKIEELRLAFDNIRKGKVDLYERLKGPEILKALYDYEGDVRAPILEDLNRRQREAGRMKNLPPWFERMKHWMPEDEEMETPPGHGIGSRLRKHLDVKEKDKPVGGNQAG